MRKTIKIVGVRWDYYSPLWIADIICFMFFPLKANFQHIKCKASISHYFALENEVKAICCVKTIEVANEYEIKTRTKYSVHIQIYSMYIKVGLSPSKKICFIASMKAPHREKAP